MENAHRRIGMLEYDRQTEKLASRVRVRVSHYIGEGEQAHLLSVFGNDSDVGAITAAVHEQSRFRLAFPDGRMQEISSQRALFATVAASIYPGENMRCGI